VSLVSLIAKTKHCLPCEGQQPKSACGPALQKNRAGKVHQREVVIPGGYFLKLRMQETSPLMSSSEEPSIDFLFFVHQLRRFSLQGLLLEGAHIGDQTLDVIVAQALGGFHDNLVFFDFQAFFDRFGGVGVLQVSLYLGIGVIFDAELLAHLGLAFAIGAVAFGAVLFVKGFSFLGLG
jgi:hypothetical protein